MSKRTRLRNMEIDEVSLVSRGAHQDAKVVLFKSDGFPPVTEDEQEAKEDEIPEGRQMSKLETFLKGVAESLGMDTEFQDVVEEMENPGDNVEKEDTHMPEGIDFDSLAPEVTEYIEKLEDKVLELEKTVESEPEGEEEVEKSLLSKADPAVVELVKSLEARASAAEEVAKAEKENRIRKEFISKAAEYDHPTISADELGPILKEASEALSEESFTAFERVLRAANESVSSMDIWKEFGSAASSGSEDEMAEKLAKGYQEEDPSLTKEQALAKAYDENPELYTQSLKEGR